MRLSDLLDRPVVDELDHEVGRVFDVRLVQDGPLQGVWGAALRVQGLLVAPRTAGMRLGYDRSGIRGPWLARLLVQLWGGRRARFVGWERVTTVERDRIRISGSGDTLPPPDPLP